MPMPLTTIGDIINEDSRFSILRNSEQKLILVSLIYNCLLAKEH
jgi:hypothetical protein